MTPRPILLLGREGQLGWELRRTLMGLGTLLAPTRAEADLAAPEGLRELVTATHPLLVVNAAAYTDVERAEDEAALADRVNGDAPGVLADTAKNLGIPLVHFSTDYVFDGAKRTAYVEDDPTAPLNAYGRSKLRGEAAIRASGGAHLILRTGWVYSNRRRNFLRTMIHLAATRPTLAVVADQWGAPTWARAIAEATATILAHSWTAAAGLSVASGLYHLSAAGETSWHGFAAAIIAERHRRDSQSPTPPVTPLATADYPTKAARPAYSVLDNSALAHRFGVTLPDWREQLSLCLDERMVP